MAAEDSSWDIDGYFIGTVQGQPVNAMFKFRTRAGRTEVKVHDALDPGRQSAVSHGPLVEAMAEHVIREFHSARARSAAQRALDPAPPMTGECRITLLHDYRCRDQSSPAAPPVTPASGRDQRSG